METAQENYARKQDELNKKIEELIEEKEKIEPEIKKRLEEEVLEINKRRPQEEIEKEDEEQINTDTFGMSRLEESRKRRQKRMEEFENQRNLQAIAEEIEKPLRTIEWELKFRNEDLGIIKEELKEDENYCQKMYK